MLIRLENLYKIYHPGPQEVRALDGVSLSVEAGEFVAFWAIPAPENPR